MGTQSNPPSNLRSKPSFSQYVSVRQRLDDLGYNNYLSNDSVPLVDKLLSDLIHYKELSSGSQKACSSKQRTEHTPSLATEYSNESFGQNANQKFLLNERKYVSQIEALKLENTKLNEKICEFKFVLDQNSAFIQKLKKDNDSKSVLILQLQNGLGKGESQQYQVSRPNIEKDGDLPSANLSKIQALYKRILSASDNPAIIDWVKAAETKISNLERELENTGKALDVCQQTCEQYRKQILEYENKLILLEKVDKNKGAQNFAQLKCRMEQKERQIKELQAQLSEAVRKQHEAMSRAIMLAGDRTHNREAATKQAGVEKKLVGLESERNVLKQMLTTTQKERDELMKEVHRLHSQESTLMSEIRNLVSDESSSAQGTKPVKNVRFQTNNKKTSRTTDSGVESSINSASQDEGGGRNRENWLKRMAEQRQSYYENVNQLLNYMKNRQDVSLVPSEQRSSSQQSSSSASQRGSSTSSFIPVPKANLSQATPNQHTVYQQQPSQANWSSSSSLPQQPLQSSYQSYQQPPLLSFQSANQQQQQPQIINFQPPNQPTPIINFQQPNQPPPILNFQQPNQQQQPSVINVQLPNQQIPQLNLQQSNQPAPPNQQPVSFSQSQTPTHVQPNFQPPAQFQPTTSVVGISSPQQQPTTAQSSPQWIAQSQGNVGQANLPQQPPTCVCGGGPTGVQQSYSQAQSGFPQTYQVDSSSMGQQPTYPQSYQSNNVDSQQAFSQQSSLFNAQQRAQVLPTQSLASSSSEPNSHRISRNTMTSMQDRRTQTDTSPVYTPTSDELNQLPDHFHSWAQSLMDEKKTLKEKNTELRLELDELAENSQISDSKMNEVTDKLQKAEEFIRKLQTDLESANARARASEQGLQVERNNLQQLRLDIDAADGNTSTLTQKFVEKSTQLDAAKQRCYQLQQNVITLEDQITSLHNQLQAIQSQNQRPNPAVQKLLDEVDSRNARILQLEKQLTAKQDVVIQRGNDIDTANGKLREMETDLQTEKGKVLQLQQDIDNSQNKLKATERELILEKNKLQQLQFDITNADSNAASLAKKMMEKSGQLDLARQRCGELEHQVAKLEEQVGTLQGQLRNIQIQRSHGETEQRQLQDELDACKARIIQLERQSVTKQETITTLQTNIQTYETKISTLEKDYGDKNSLVELNRRTNERLSTEIDKSRIDNAALRQENERLIASLAQFRADLDHERQGAEDLRREIQSYVSHVRQVESILARKDEEKDALLKQFQHLANETNSFDSERENMERSIRSQQQEVATLQAELSTVRRRLGELEQLYSQQKSAVAQAEMQADDLMRRMSVLERDLRDARGDKMRLEQQLATANELQTRLEKQLEKLRIEAAQADSTNHQMETETTRLHEDLHIFEQRLTKEKENVRNLESIVSILRQERAQQETQMRTMSQDLTRLHHREILLQEELANMKAELCATEGKVADLTRENQRLKQEVLQEKFEREKTRQELRRLGNLSNNTPPLVASYNISPAPAVALHNLSAATICTPTTFPGTGAGSSTSTSPRKRMTVAARFANNETQT